jgi:hypothetical protein
VPRLPPSDLPATTALDRDRHHVIPPAAQLAVARHAPAYIVKVDASHPAAVTRLIVAAAGSTS